jgi:hypothetical protein
MYIYIFICICINGFICIYICIYIHIYMNNLLLCNKIGDLWWEKDCEVFLSNIYIYTYIYVCMYLYMYV